jgi:hypothetical protein
MADDKRQEPGSITKTADAQDERISGISNISKTIGQMQKNTEQKMEDTEESMDYGAAPESSVREMNGILSNFGKTISAFTKGIQDVSLSTARATKDAIGQYGKAIGQDISFNKQNVVAMALARTTPLFGYFAAKFMETDVFKKAKDRMSESIANTFKGIGSSIANIFKGKEKAHEEAVPKMQRGGYIEKGGMIEVHPAEVVMPIEKILQRIDDSISVGREIAEITSKTQMRSLAKMSTFVSAERDKEPVGMVKGFLRAMREVQTQYEEPSNVRLLRAVLSIQDTMGAQIGTWQQIWTKMLVEHPTFRQIAFAMKTVGSLFGAPFKLVFQLFKQRGGYLSQLSKSKNPFENMSQNIGILYTGTMHRLDNIAYYTKATAVMLRDVAGVVSQGKLKYGSIESISEGTRSLFGWARFGFHNLLKYGPRIVAGGIDIMLGGKGTGMAFPAAKKFGDWITREIEWGTKAQQALKSGRQKRKDWALGDSGGLTEVIRDQYKNKLPPMKVVNVTQTDVVDILKAIEYNSESTTEQLEHHNKREKRKGLLGFFSMLGSGAMSMMSMAGGWIKNLLGLGKGGFLSKAIGGLFGKGGPIALALGSAAFWTPVIAVIGSALIGYGIGTAINKWLIAPLRDALWDKWNKSNKEAAKSESKSMSAALKAARGETATGVQAFQGKVETRARGSMAIIERREKLGTDFRFMEVQKGQMDFVRKNLSEYSKYDPDMLKTYRQQWLKGEGKWIGSRWFFQNPQKYGARREAAFMQWLERKGVKADTAAMVKEHETAIMESKGVVGKAGYMARKYGPGAKQWLAEKGKYAIDQAGQIVEKATGKIIGAKELAKMQAADLITTSKLLGQELKKRGIEGLEGLKGLGDTLQQNMNSVSNAISNQTSQVTRIFNAGGEKAGALIDEMSQRIVTGNFH